MIGNNIIYIHAFELLIIFSIYQALKNKGKYR